MRLGSIDSPSVLSVSSVVNSAGFGLIAEDGWRGAKGFRMDIVVDTNVLVAGLRSRNGASNALLHKIREGNVFVLHLSTAAVLEYEEVLVRELVPDYLESRDILWFLDDLIAASVRHASIRRFRPISNDPDDDCMIELALTAYVQVLVTHNKAHFRDLPARGIEVLTPAEILRFLNL